MSIRIVSPPVPLIMDDTGVIRVRGSRVTLETVVEAFRLGATAEEIAQQYPSVSLADVYGVIDFFLHNEVDVEEYLRQAQIEGDRVRAWIEQRFPSDGIRERLLARREQRLSNGNVASGD